MGKVPVFCVLCGGVCEEINPIDEPFVRSEDNGYLSRLFVLTKVIPDGVDNREGIYPDYHGGVISEDTWYHPYGSYEELEAGQAIHQGCYTLLHNYFKARGSKGITISNHKLFDYFFILGSGLNFDTTTILQDEWITLTQEQDFCSFPGGNWIVRDPTYISIDAFPSVQKEKALSGKQQLNLFMNFPLLVQDKILSYLDLKALSNLQKTSKLLKQRVQTSLTWNLSCRKKLYFDILSEDMKNALGGMKILDFDDIVTRNENVASLRRIGLILDRLLSILPEIEEFNNSFPYNYSVEANILFSDTNIQSEWLKKRFELIKNFEDTLYPYKFTQPQQN